MERDKGGGGGLEREKNRGGVVRARVCAGVCVRGCVRVCAGVCVCGAEQSKEGKAFVPCASAQNQFLRARRRRYEARTKHQPVAVERDR